MLNMLKYVLLGGMDMACRYYYFSGFDHKCSIKGSYGSIISDSQYSRYCKNNFNRCSNFDITNKVTNKNSNNPNNGNNNSGCFITTVVCNILGKKDNDELLHNFRSFRDNVLQKDKKYEEILKSYDTVGPVVGDAICNDKEKNKMAKAIYNSFLMPINKLIKQEKYDEACERYYVMTLGLINYYGLKHEYNEHTDNNYGYNKNEIDIKNSGHGKVRILTNSSVDM